jgi:DNA-binding transcriptional LysR family regulator
MDLNDLRVFEKVGSLLNFSAAAQVLGLPKSSVSRSVARLEVTLGVRLCQRTTRQVVLTEPGAALMARCAEIMGKVRDTVDHVGGLTATPRGLLRITTGIGFGLNVLSEQIPRFLLLYPDISIALDMTDQSAELVAEGIDVAIRLGPMADSHYVSVKLGLLGRYLCASPSYLDKYGFPVALDDLTRRDTVEMPGLDGRPRRWSFRRGENVRMFEIHPRVSVNDALTIHRMIVNGAGIGVISGYLCAPEIAAGRLVRLFPEWKLDPVEVNLVFPSRRDLSPAVRAFVDFMKSASRPGALWQHEPVQETGTDG